MIFATSSENLLFCSLRSDCGAVSRKNSCASPFANCPGWTGMLNSSSARWPTCRGPASHSGANAPPAFGETNFESAGPSVPPKSALVPNCSESGVSVSPSDPPKARLPASKPVCVTPCKAPCAPAEASLVAVPAIPGICPATCGIAWPASPPKNRSACGTKGATAGATIGATRSAACPKT